MKFLIFLLLLFATTSCSHNNLNSIKIETSLTEAFLNEVCSGNQEKDLISRWDKYEKKYWNFYQQVYYDSLVKEKRRNDFLAASAAQNGSVCLAVKKFKSAAPSVVKEMNELVTKLMGVSPVRKIWFAVALQLTDGRATEYKSEPVLVLNSWHDTFTRFRAMKATIAHELIHDSQSVLYRIDK